MGAPKRSLSPRNSHTQKENPAKAKKSKAKEGSVTDAAAKKLKLKEMVEKLKDSVVYDYWSVLEITAFKNSILKAIDEL
jgi:hypothetical protein